MASLYNYLATKLQVASYYNQNPSDVETVGTIKTTLPPKRGIASFQKNNRVFTSTGFSAVLFIQNATQVSCLKNNPLDMKKHTRCRLIRFQTESFKNISSFCKKMIKNKAFF